MIVPKNWKEAICSVDEIIEEIFSCGMIKKKDKDKRTIEYYNVPCAFDIETSSFIDDSGEKAACMYIWMFAANCRAYYGRTWDSYFDFMKKLELGLGLGEDRRLPVYVQNLAYEFQFFRKHIDWERVFAIKRLTPVVALSTTGVEYRCSLILSGGMSLDRIGKDLLKYKYTKKVGDLDYSKLRGSSTPLTDTEMGYCIGDVLVLNCYIQEKIEQDGNIALIPMTNTGYVRRLCRNSCTKIPGTKHLNREYRNLMKTLILDYEEYKQLERAFQGGFTHANADYVGEILYNVKSEDFTSSYPATMIAEQFPMSKSIPIDDNTANEYLDMYVDTYCCLFDIELFDVSPIQVENIISISKVVGMTKEERNNTIVNNGRIVSAPRVYTTVTDVDYRNLEKFYMWDKSRSRVHNMRVYKRGYLPTEFVRAILDLYESKTKLKGNSEKLVEYMISKGMLNSSYGMAVTKIIREIIEYNDDWLSGQPDNYAELIDTYNKSMGRFLFYPWGVWITAYARRNLFTAILELGNDYIYSDTDSVKFLNYEKHKEYFLAYNKEMEVKLNNAMQYHNLPFELCNPYSDETKDNMLIGAWDDDGNYKVFKTLGAKRYLTINTKGKGSLTVAGCNKNKGLKYLQKTYGLYGMFYAFNEGLVIPAEESGRNIHSYGDECEGTFVDYLGNIQVYHELSFVHMENSEYTMNMADEYKDYLMGRGYIII